MSKKKKSAPGAKTQSLNAGTSVKPPRPAPPIAIVVSRYNPSVTQKLLEGAVDAYATHGGRSASILAAPGSYELVSLAHAAAKTGRFKGVVALGCLVKGETRHDEYIASAVAHGLIQASIDAGIPIAFGVLTVDTPKQAKARAGGKKGNKGAEAMHAVLDTIDAIEALHGMRSPSGLGLDDHGRLVPDKVKKSNGGTKNGVVATGEGAKR